MYRQLRKWPGSAASRAVVSGQRRVLSGSSDGRRSLFKITTLPNGLRVATDGPPGHFSALGLYVDAGSRYEGTSHTGLSHMMDRLAYQATKGYSADDMQSKLSQLGGNYMCVSSRESIIYQAAVFNKDVASMFELLSATARWAEVTPEELQTQKETAEYEIGEIWRKPELILPELLHTAAYENNTLGLPLLCPEDRLPGIRGEDVQDYRAKFYTPDRMVAAFVGVDHDFAVELAMKQFGDMPRGTVPVQTEVSQYSGGVMSVGEMEVEHVPNQPDLAHIYLAFEGLSINDPDIYALATLQTLLGGGGSFSAGGPGKGMYSRLYTSVLNRYGFLETCAAFNHSYTDSGLFGVMVACLPSHASMVPAIICSQLAYCMSKFTGGLSKVEVQRAKNQLRSSLLMNLESKMVELEDLGRQVQVTGKKVTVDEMCEKIDMLTVADIVNVARRVFRGQVYNVGTSKNGPTIIMQGPEGSFGDVLEECRKYGLGGK
ncbi:Metalloenzyme, LuxS/M16 peptidase-like protein [Lipomyces orientalis]|uniref:Metalloenzyme, LuxS/M16 peptidase-like protein n=1 Tax=Lipomyces orientalis TaxID=1233043 RepID=A0ACC3TYF7_9ASCO